MAFCAYCGKQLEDGEVCTCRSQANTGSENVTDSEVMNEKIDVKDSFGGIGNLLKNSFKTPISAAEDFFNNASITTSGIAIAIVTAIYMITSLLYVVTRSVYEIIAYKSTLGIFSSALSTSAILKLSGINVGTYIMGFFFPLLYMVFITGTAIGLLYLISTLVLKEKFDLRKSLALCGCASLTVAAISVLTIITNIIHVGGITGTVFAAAKRILGFIAMLQGLNALKCWIGDRKRIVISSIIMIAGLVIVNYIVSFLFRLGTGYFFTLPF